MTGTSDLTPTQKGALADLRRKGELFARSAAWHGTNQRTYNRRTLQALVEAGAAQWTHITLDGRRFDAVTTARTATSTSSQEETA